MKIYKEEYFGINKDPSELKKGEIIGGWLWSNLYVFVYLGKKNDRYKFYDIQTGLIMTSTKSIVR